MRCLRDLALIVLITLPLMLFNRWPEQRESGELLYQSLRATNATVQEASVQGWARLKPGIWTMKKLENVLQEGVAVLDDPPQNYRIETDSTAEQDSIRIILTDSVRQFTITASTKHDANAFISVVLNGPAEQISNYQRQADNILHAVGGRATISSCLVGWINGKLNNGDWASILSRSFTVLEANIIDEMSDAKIASVTGHSPHLPEGLKINGAQINVNIASRYSSYDNRTYITIGSPLIAREY